MKNMQNIIRFLGTASLLHMTLGIDIGVVGKARDSLSRDIELHSGGTGDIADLDTYKEGIFTRQSPYPAVDLVVTDTFLCILPGKGDRIPLPANTCHTLRPGRYLNRVIKPKSIPTGQKCKFMAYKGENCAGPEPLNYDLLGCLLGRDYRSYRWECKNDPEAPQPDPFPSASATLYEKNDCIKEGEAARKFEVNNIVANKCENFNAADDGFRNFSSSTVVFSGEPADNALCFWEVYGKRDCQDPYQFKETTTECLTNQGGRFTLNGKPGLSYRLVCSNTLPSADVTLYNSTKCDPQTSFPKIQNLPFNKCRDFDTVDKGSMPDAEVFRGGIATLKNNEKIPDGFYCSFRVYNQTGCQSQIDGGAPGTCRFAYYEYGPDDTRTGKSFQWYCKEFSIYDEF